MSINEIESAVKTYREYKRIKEEAESMMEAAADALKAHMMEAQTDTLTGIDYKATYKVINGTTFDKKALEADHPGAVAMYTRPNPYRRFEIR